MTPAGGAGPRYGEPNVRRSPLSLILLGAAGFLVFCGLVALGTWQVHRLSWKLDLIARVDSRVHAEPIAPPGPADWPHVSADRDEYRHVRVSGTFLNDRETLVQAVTVEGPGFWVVTPLRTASGITVLINRGFVPSDRRDPATRAEAQVGGTTVTGLLRITEPKGAFLRSNDAGANRWYSRDVAAIAAARSLSEVAPYFVDADATPNPGGYPVGGLTIINFPNSHLVYAITWSTLAALLLGAAVWTVRDEMRRRRTAAARPVPRGTGPASLNAP